MTLPSSAVSGDYTRGDNVAVPCVSVITPLFNKGPFVVETIASVLAQTMSNWEMLIVDDGSTDDGVAEVKKFADKRLRLFELKHRGPAAARNFGIAQARGEWIQFLDADDLLEPYHLQQQLDDAQSEPDADIVACGWTEFDFANEKSRKWRPPAGRGGGRETLLDSAICSAPWASHAAMVRRVMLAGELLWPEELDSLLGEDIVFWCRLIHICLVKYGSSEGVFYRAKTPGCRTQSDDPHTWFAGVHAAVQLNLEYLERRGQRPLTSGQCGHLMRTYSDIYLIARHRGAEEIAENSIALASYWLRRYFRAGGERSAAMLSRQALGLKLFLRLRGNRSALAA